MDTAVDSKKNAGEWAEFYALLKILSDGKLYSADGDLNINTSEYLPVISIEMQSRDNNELIKYVVDTSSMSIHINQTREPAKKISMTRFKSEAANFFKIISERKGASFAVPEISGLLSELGNPITKQASDRKADIHIVIHDTITGFNNEVGFSIKSKHSKPATLINASGQTLFKYRITGVSEENRSEVADALSPAGDRGPKERIQALLSSGFGLEFETVKKQEFRENIQLIDSSLDIYLAECLLVFMSGSENKLKNVVKAVSQRNPCNYRTSCDERLLEFYQYKMKRLIVDAAMGMQPKARWTGSYDASGGYLIVKEDGDVICYHFFNWNALQDYLFNSLRFETPTSTGTGSKASFNYALHYHAEGQDYMDICLQIRFI